MKLRNFVFISAFLVGSMFVKVPTGEAKFLPENDLHLHDNLSLISNVTESQFNSIIDQAVEFYEPIIASHGGTLVMKRDWQSSTVNAYASRNEDNWIVMMFGGLARRPEVTPDGFAMVVCHEMGHHLGGFPEVVYWASNEGQADYFASQVCAKRMWKDQTSINAGFRSQVNEVAKSKCDSVYKNVEDQNLCYRISVAGESLATMLAVLRENVVPSYSTPDQNKVSRTINSHPEPQCRLDTYLAGAICTTEFDDFIIPGRGFGNRWEAEKEAINLSCSQFNPDHIYSQKPGCWYKQRYNESFAL